MTKYGIKDITDIKFIIPKMNLIKKNKPDAMKVTEEEYYKFLEENSKYIVETHLNTAADSYSVLDQYGNIIAGIYFYMQVDYYINPELLKLGIEKKMYIKNDYETVGEEVLSADMNTVKVKSFNEVSWKPQ